MRLWSLNPSYLDARGLVALWREGLLAQRVLLGLTRGYRHHPQLERFRTHADPHAAIAAYLHGVCEEAQRRGYRFDRTKICTGPDAAAMAVTSGQLSFEWEHLMRKLKHRAPEKAVENERVALPNAHPLFRVVDGPVASWERPGHVDAAG